METEMKMQELWDVSKFYQSSFASGGVGWWPPGHFFPRAKNTKVTSYLRSMSCQTILSLFPFPFSLFPLCMMLPKKCGNFSFL